MSKPTKGAKARVTLEALVYMMNDPKNTVDEFTKIALHAGRWGAISRYSGYLSTQQINEELDALEEQVDIDKFKAALQFIAEAGNGS